MVSFEWLGGKLLIINLVFYCTIEVPVFPRRAWERAAELLFFLMLLEMLKLFIIAPGPLIEPASNCYYVGIGPVAFFGLPTFKLFP